MEQAIHLILLASGLLLASILTSLIAKRLGAPLLLLFLAVGVIAGPDGLGHIVFDNHDVAFLVGSVALAIILFESGLDTKIHSFRIAAAPALSLASIGTLATALLVGACSVWLLKLSWTEGLLLGAIISSTDAAAVFFMLRVGNIEIRDRVRSTLEIESGSNDPIAIVLTIMLIEILLNPAEQVGLLQIAAYMTAHLGIGLFCGLAAGYAIVQSLNRLHLEAGLMPIITLAIALFVFGLTGAIGGSGFLAVYVAGLVAANRKLRQAGALKRFHNGLSWLAQIIMFVMMGLMVDLQTVLKIIGPALLLAGLLMLIIRPLSSIICLLPFRFSWRESLFVGWVGLRGAVSILLALLPVLAGLPNADTLFAIVFVMVSLSLLLQGWTIKPAAHLLHLIVPPRHAAIERHELDLPLDADLELVAYTLVPNSPAVLNQRLPKWARPALIVRHGQLLKYHQSNGLAKDDHIYVFANESQLAALDLIYAPPTENSMAEREFFGDLCLRPETLLADLTKHYALPVAAHDQQLCLEQLFARELGGNFDVGDQLPLGQARLIIRKLDMLGRIEEIGLALQDGIEFSDQPLWQKLRQKLLKRIRQKK